VQYQLELARPAARDGAPLPRSRERIAHFSYDPAVVPRRARELATQLRRSLPADAAQFEIAERFRSDLAARFKYLAPGTEGGARDLSEFLSGAAGAHCEYFATALALMLRVEGIPCRVVTGYRSEEWEPGRSTLTIRARDAHAWVEVLDPGGGWYTVDPTPSIGVPGLADRGLFARVGRLANDLWSAVSGFDAKARTAMFAWIAEVPQRIARHPGQAALVSVALALLLIGAHLRRAGAGEPHARAYRRALRRLKLDLAPGETPRELLARARRTACPAPGLRELEGATAAHESARNRA
jgi:hypothetical protein